MALVCNAGGASQSDVTNGSRSVILVSLPDVSDAAFQNALCDELDGVIKRLSNNGCE